MVIKNSQKMIKTANKNENKKPLGVFPNLKQLIITNSFQTKQTKNQQQKKRVIFCQL